MSDDASTRTDWNACYRAGETPWEKGAPAPPLLEWLAQQPGHRCDGDSILVPGCGFGHDVRALARAHPRAEVVGLDIAPAAIECARSFPSEGNERYALADLFALPAAAWRGRFDWVFEHTCFCAIDPARRAEYVAAVAQALRLGGRLLAIFYLEPWAGGEPLPPGGGPPFGVTVDELDKLFATQFRLVEEQHPSRAYPGREGRELLRVMEKIRNPNLEPSAARQPL